MAWRTLFIATPTKLSVKNSQLCIIQEETVTVPLEDISVIILECPQINMSVATLSLLLEARIVLYTCDNKHLPNGVLLPFNVHSRQTKMNQVHMGLTEPFKKRSWQQVVTRKIQNQAKCLELLECKGTDYLIKLSHNVLSGDSDNREGVAAKYYFAQLFGKFTRLDETPLNAALDYGYAIMRGAVARSIVSYGFIPCLGIFHRSEVNQFNLADDFMEVLRPVIDLWAAQHMIDQHELTKEYRARLVNLLHHDIKIRDENQTVLHAIQVMLSSFSSACQSGDFKKLQLPELIPLQLHSYE
ncbi:MAG: type II CRISPR-associated endonuclease Cas1 [Hyphomonadaceae bacterium]|nr:type II CRISPR-associated endonuclease Cas1 [Clostridia bacterium]